MEGTGIGIPEDHLHRMFAPFTQADASTTREFGGTGLGLSISRQLAELMDGTIEAENRLGEGSTFRFKLSLPADPDPPPVSLPRTVLGDVRVIILGDNAVNRRVLHEQTTSWGMGNSGYASGPEALHALRAAIKAGDPFQIALIDYRMPGTDGPTLARKIKSDPTLASTVLVLLTSTGHRGDPERMKEAGFAGYLVKPVRQSKLMDVLETVWVEHVKGKDPRLVTRHTVVESAPPHREGEQKKARIRVLVAEDNIVNQKVTLRMLEKFGCRVDVAANGDEAVQMAKQFPYTLIFMDCLMPEMDGYEATAAIREMEKHTPIIAITAKAMGGGREKCLAPAWTTTCRNRSIIRALKEMLDKWSPPTPPANSPIANSLGQSRAATDSLMTRETASRADR